MAHTIGRKQKSTVSDVKTCEGINNNDQKVFQAKTGFGGVVVLADIRPFFKCA